MIDASETVTGIGKLMDRTEERIKGLEDRAMGVYCQSCRQNAQGCD